MNHEDVFKMLSLEPGATAEAIKTAASQKKADL